MIVRTRKPAIHGTSRGKDQPASQSTVATYQQTAPAAITLRCSAGWMRWTTT